MKAAYAHVTHIERRVSGAYSAGHCPVYEASARNPEGGLEGIYFKVVEGRGVLNELLVDEVARFLGVRVARTYACACPRSLLEKQNTPFLVKRDVWCRGIASVATPHARYNGNGIGVHLEKDLLNWPGLPRAAAFDELVLNDDRNYQNILRVAESDFVLIDHEQALGGTETQVDQDPFLCPATPGSNQLAGVVFGSQHNFTIKRAIAESYALADEIKKFVLDEPEKFDQVAGTEKGTASFLIELIQKRGESLPELLDRHKAANDLFALSSA